MQYSLVIRNPKNNKQYRQREREKEKSGTIEEDKRQLKNKYLKSQYSILISVSITQKKGGKQ